MRKLIWRGLIYDLLIEWAVRRIKQSVARRISQNDLSPVLDLCCGTGKQCRLIGDNGQKAIGLDIDSKMIEYAASKYPHLPFVCADASRLPFRGKSLRGIVISYALHEKTPEMRSRMLAEAEKLLAPGGSIILVDYEIPWNGLSRLGNFFTWIIEWLAGGEHYKNRNEFLKQGGLEEFINQNKLVIVKKYPIALGNSSLSIVKFSKNPSNEDSEERNTGSH
jgi:demethylmenaquinone methyltransferase/2-methoxy-6-polyprenyl-1,4-benzoquinol methylase